MPQYEPGDVIEIRLDDRTAHLQMTHNHPSYPPVIRVMKKGKAADATEAARLPTAFVVMMPLSSALEKAAVPVKHMGKAEIPPQERAFPTFRTPIRDKKGEIIYWWLWDGQSLRYETGLDDETASLPIREVTSVAELLNRIKAET